MKKNIRILGKIILILFGTICFVWLIHKDKTFFQLKQPIGEAISCEDAGIVIQAVISGLKDNNNLSDVQVLDEWVQELNEQESSEVLLYEDYERLLTAFKENKNGFYEAYLYKEKYRPDFYLLKEDWYDFFDTLLNNYKLQDVIQKEETVILTGKENLTAESIGTNELLTKEGEVVKYHSGGFKNCNFSYVTVYYKDSTEGDFREFLTVVNKTAKKFTLSNAWVMEVQEGSVQFFYKGFEIEHSFAGNSSSNDIKREAVSDILCSNGKIIKVQAKMDRISGKLLRRNEKELELEGKGIYPFADNMVVYRLYEELRECRAEDLKIGYAFADYVLEDGKICAALMMRTEDMETIRVAVRNNGFQSLYHESLTLQADCDMTLIYGEYENRQQMVIKEGETIEIERGSAYLEGARAELIPAAASGKLKICSLTRNQGNPVYRGKFELAETGEGILLINEVLLEEYLYSVVPSEMPASYPQEALKAQAVCARTYGYKYLYAPGLADIGAHVDDSVGYQVYNNIAEDYRATKAVKETTGELLFYGEEMVDTYYYSTSCGFGTDAGIWQEQNTKTMPYLRSRHITDAQEGTPQEMETEENIKAYLSLVHPLDYEAKEPWYRWDYEAAAFDVEELYKRLQTRYAVASDKILTLQDEEYVSMPIQEFQEIKEFTVAQRREGGVMEALIVTTDAGTYKIISEYNIRYILNAGGSVRKQDGTQTVLGELLPSAYFTIEPIYTKENVTGYYLRGGGYGHGVGMSQNAAKTMGSQGKSYEEILRFFYQDCEVKKEY